MELDNILKKLEERAIGYSSEDSQISGDFFVKFKRVWETIRSTDFENSIVDFYSSSTNNDDSVSKLSSEMAYLKTFDLSDWVVDLNKSKYIGEGTQKVSDTWRMIVKAAEVAELEDEVNEEKKKKYKEQLKTIDRKAIRDAEDHLEESIINFNEKLTEIVFNGGEQGPQLWGQLGKIYKRRVRYARVDLEIAADEYNDLTAKMTALGEDPAVFAINRAEERLEEYSSQLGDKEAVPLTYMNPSDWYEPKADGWKKISDVNTNENIKGVTKRNNVGIGLGLNLGFWKIGPKVEIESEKQETEKINDNLTVDCEYLIPRVRRPWMDTSLLKAGNWYIKNHPKNSVSDGNPIQDKGNKSQMFLPSVVTGLILVKNVKIRWKKNTEETENLKREISLGGSFGYGLMQIVGKYKGGKDKNNLIVEVEENGITIKGIQLIGYVCKVLPSSPQLDSKISESNE